jgi:spore coat protein B
MNTVLKNLKYSWIKINRKGPESIEGLLVELNDGHLVLIANNEVFRIALYHVKNFSVAVKMEQNSNEEQQNNNQSNQNQSNQNQSNNQNDSNSNEQSDNNKVYSNKVERYKAQRSRRRRQVRQG